MKMYIFELSGKQYRVMASEKFEAQNKLSRVLVLWGEPPVEKWNIVRVIENCGTDVYRV